MICRGLLCFLLDIPDVSSEQCALRQAAPGSLLASLWLGALRLDGRREEASGAAGEKSESTAGGRSVGMRRFRGEGELGGIDSDATRRDGPQTISGVSLHTLSWSQGTLFAPDPVREPVDPQSPKLRFF